MLSAIVYVGCPILFVLGAMSDFISYRIPNWISLGLVGLFALAVPFSDISAMTVVWHVVVGIAGLALGMLAFGFNIVGGGDAKLFAAAALWMGPFFVLPYCLVFALIGGGLAMLILLLRRVPLPVSTIQLPGIRHLLHPKAGMPYGVALGLGALIILHSSKYLAIWF